MRSWQRRAAVAAAAAMRMHDPPHPLLAVRPVQHVVLPPLYCASGQYLAPAAAPPRWRWCHGLDQAGAIHGLPSLAIAPAAPRTHSEYPHSSRRSSFHKQRVGTRSCSQPPARPLLNTKPHGPQTPKNCPGPRASTPG